MCTVSAATTAKPLEVDCSKAGEGYKYVDPKLLGKRKLLSVTPGCHLLRGQGSLAYVTLSMRELIALSSFSTVALQPQSPGLLYRSNCVKTVCPCEKKACGDSCVPAKAGSGPFKCQTYSAIAGRSAGAPKCLPAASVKCAGKTTTGWQ